MLSNPRKVAHLGTMTIAAALLGSACGGGSTPRDATDAPRPPGVVLTTADIDRIAGQVAVARRLPPQRTVAYELLAPDEFVKLVRTKTSPDDSDESSDLTEEGAFLLGFNFVPEPEKRGAISSVEDVLAEEIAGFYDIEQDRVFVPAVETHDEADALIQRAVVAHEIHHALQAQHFQIPKADALPNDDARLAQLALIEGDAMVAMGAYLGLDLGAPVRRTLRMITDVVKAVPITDLAHEQEKSALERALALTQRRLKFPYDDGMVFVSDIYRAGGFDLVDALYDRMPASTEHILHPERYIEGDWPREIAPPAAPAGFEIVYGDVLGELQIRTLFEQCLPGAEAITAAEGWGGDRFSVATDPSGRLVTLWSSVWDSEEDAAEFDAALGRADACFHDNRLGSDERDFTISSEVSHSRKGDRVAFVRGLPKALGSAEMQKLLALDVSTPSVAPLASVSIPPRRPLPEPQLGRVTTDIYRSGWLGLMGRVPSGMRWSTGEQGAELWVERPDVLVMGGLFVSDRVTTAEQNERAFAAVRWAFAKQVEMLGRDVIPIAGGPTTSPLGNAEERLWQVTGTPIQVRMVLVPICAGTGSLVFLQAYGDPYARTVLDGWFQTFRFEKGRNLPACERLDPK